MPRLEIGERSERWSLSTLDSILFPKLRAKHKKMSQLIKKHYDTRSNRHTIRLTKRQNHQSKIIKSIPPFLSL